MKKAIVLFLCAILGLVSLKGQETEIWKDKRANIDLLNFLDTKMITDFNVESDLSFQFWKGSFPDLEVDTILRPGRYGYYVEITGANGILMKRGGEPCSVHPTTGWAGPSPFFPI